MIIFRKKTCLYGHLLYAPLFLQTIEIYISVPPVPFWSCLHQKTLPGISFRIYKTVMISTWRHISKLLIPGEKDYVYHPEQILDDTMSTIHGFSTLAASNKFQIIVRSRTNKFQSNRCNHLKATNSSLIPTNTRHLHHHNQTLPPRPSFLPKHKKISRRHTPPLLLLLLLSWGTLGRARSVTPCVSLPCRR